MSERPHRVDLAPSAQRQLRRLPPGDAARLRAPILALGIEAMPPGARRCTGTEFWRLRNGDLRVVYAIEADGTVVVLRVARRSESTYRHLER